MLSRCAPATLFLASLISLRTIHSQILQFRLTALLPSALMNMALLLATPGYVADREKHGEPTYPLKDIMDARDKKKRA